jgi:acetolactate synthase-1/2/3 large subunit
MNGAQALLRTLLDSGVDVCFANPGTSEMHFVAALDDVPEMRGVLGLFEGVVTGAADGYARMAGRPAATLLHLGPGLGNGLANLHNARRARTPIVNVVGDHALDHKALDAPLESDIDAVAGSVSGWVRRSESVAALASDAAEAVGAARSGAGVATLILPADIAWTEGAAPAAPAALSPAPVPPRARGGPPRPPPPRCRLRRASTTRPSAMSRRSSPPLARRRRCSSAGRSSSRAGPMRSSASMPPPERRRSTRHSRHG